MPRFASYCLNIASWSKNQIRLTSYGHQSWLESSIRYILYLPSLSKPESSMPKSAFAWALKKLFIATFCVLRDLYSSIISSNTSSIQTWQPHQVQDQKHFVWATQYQFQVFQVDIASRVRKLVHQIDERYGIKIPRRVVSKDHFHIMVSVSSKNVPLEIMQLFKGRNFTWHLKNSYR